MSMDIDINIELPDSHEKAINISTQILDGSVLYSEDNINDLAHQIKLLYDKGLNSVNITLFNQTKKKKRKILDFLTEHNFAAEIALINGVNILYEPIEGNSIDFVLNIEQDENINVQIKRLSQGETIDRLTRFLDLFEKKLSEIKHNKFIVLGIDVNNAKTEEISKYIEFINHCSLKETYAFKYYFPHSSNPILEIEFIKPNKLSLDNLELGVVFNLDDGWQKMTTVQRIFGAFEKAAKNFMYVDASNINVIVMEINFEEDFSKVIESIYGSSLTHVSSDGSIISIESVNGVFQKEDLLNKISCVLILFRKNSKLISKYNKVLCPLQITDDQINSIKKVFDFDIFQKFNG